MGRLGAYLRLMRVHRPIGFFLLLWPTLWALWWAAEGVPEARIVAIFCAGVVLMRAAGCAFNDYVDRHIDVLVERTRDRPLPSGAVAPREALLLAAGLAGCAFGLVLLTNRLTVLLAVAGGALTLCYPFMKRYIHAPQLVLGVAFAWCVPMAFAAQTGGVPAIAWLLFLVTALWILCYDTLYALTDMPDDIRIGIRSTAILFGRILRSVVALLQSMVVIGLLFLGEWFGCGVYYWRGVGVMGLLFVYQHWLITSRGREGGFLAFRNNGWAGAAVFVGLFLDYALR